MNNFSQLNHDVIRKHQLNKSRSKNAYQFSKTSRFLSANPQCPQAFYANDSQLSKRKASFGYGKKSDFTKTLTCSPSSTKYQHKSLFAEKKGKTFGDSRDKSPDQSYFIPQLHKVPGPGQYQNQIKTQMTISYSLREKTKDFIKQKITIKDNPGPGKYSDIDLEPKTGRFSLSKYEDTKFAKINAKPPRFPQGKDSPGPLSYREGDNMSARGKYVLSHRKGRGTRPFDSEVRKTFTDSFKDSKKMVPGPGNYDLASEFGVYGQYDDVKMKATIH